MQMIISNFHYCFYRLVCDEDIRSPRTEGRLCISILLGILPTMIFLYKNKPLKIFPNELFFYGPAIMCALIIRLGIDHKKWSKKADIVIKKNGYWHTAIWITIVYISIIVVQALSLRFFS